MVDQMDELRYPIGDFQYDADSTPEKHREWVGVIARTPWKLRAVIAGMMDEQIRTPYRPGGWTVRQVIHHMADSHMNSFIRFKLALTEGNPTIKPYDEAAWAMLPDGRDAPIELSLKLLDVLHERWTILLESMKPEEFARTFHHPERGPMHLDMALQLYAWHSNHHIAHIAELKKRRNW
ncbi:MAG: YfiT family bacillithiol transferase [Blastocatellia bacterium]